MDAAIGRGRPIPRLPSEAHASPWGAFRDDTKIWGLPTRLAPRGRGWVRTDAPEGARAGQPSPATATGAERRLPAGAATAHLLPKGGAVRRGAAERLQELGAVGRRGRCAVERARSARALSPAPPPHLTAPRAAGSLGQHPPVANHGPRAARGGREGPRGPRPEEWYGERQRGGARVDVGATPSMFRGAGRRETPRGHNGRISADWRAGRRGRWTWRRVNPAPNGSDRASSPWRGSHSSPRRRTAVFSGAGEMSSFFVRRRRGGRNPGTDGEPLMTSGARVRRQVGEQTRGGVGYFLSFLPEGRRAAGG